MGNIRIIFGLITSAIVLILVITHMLYDQDGLWFTIDYSSQSSQRACTEEAKLCPDGSSVGRVGPNCEFAQCSNANDQSLNERIYTNSEFGFSFSHPSNTKVEVVDERPQGGGVYLYIGHISESSSLLSRHLTKISIENWIKSIDDFISQQCDVPDVCALPSEATTISVAGRTAKKFKPPAPIESDSVSFIKGQELFTFSVTYDKSYLNNYGLEVEDKLTIFNRILSTFKFIDEFVANSYLSQQECESETGKTCAYSVCDYIPKGKTVEEVCGDRAKKGWYPN